MKSGAGDDPFSEDVAEVGFESEAERETDATLDETGNEVDDVRTGEGVSKDFVDEIVAGLEDIEDGSVQKTIAVRDGRIKALLIALDESDGDELVNLGQSLQEALGRDLDDEFDRSTIVRLAFRVALQEAAPETWEQLTQALGRYARRNI